MVYGILSFFIFPYLFVGDIFPFLRRSENIKHVFIDPQIKHPKGIYDHSAYVHGAKCEADFLMTIRVYALNDQRVMDFFCYVKIPILFNRYLKSLIKCCNSSVVYSPVSRFLNVTCVLLSLEVTLIIRTWDKKRFCT